MIRWLPVIPHTPDIRFSVAPKSEKTTLSYWEMYFSLLTAAVWWVDWCSTALKAQLGRSLESARVIIAVMDFQEEILILQHRVQDMLIDYTGFNVQAGSSSVAPYEVYLDLEAPAIRLLMNEMHICNQISMCVCSITQVSRLWYPLWLFISECTWYMGFQFSESPCVK